MPRARSRVHLRVTVPPRAPFFSGSRAWPDAEAAVRELLALNGTRAENRWGAVAGGGELAMMHSIIQVCSTVPPSQSSATHAAP